MANSVLLHRDNMAALAYNNDSSIIVELNTLILYITWLELNTLILYITWFMA
jgi:hypothetical protein